MKNTFATSQKAQPTAINSATLQVEEARSASRSDYRRLARTGRNLILGVLVCALAALLHATEAAGQPVVPSGWQLDQAASSNGVSVYKNGSSTFVTVISLSGPQAATVTPVAQPDGTYYSRYPKYALISSRTFHEEQRNVNVGRDVYTYNLSFFDNKSQNPSYRSLSFALKVNGNLQTEGHNNQPYCVPSEPYLGQTWPGRGLFLGHDGLVAVVNSADPQWNNLIASSRHFAVGLDPGELYKNGGSRIQRTFTAALDLNRDGRSEYLLILSTKSATVAQANALLNAWVPTQFRYTIIQFDGGGSTAFVAKGVDKITPNRKLPSFLTVVSAAPAPPSQSCESNVTTLSCGTNYTNLTTVGYPRNINSYPANQYWQHPGSERRFRVWLGAGQRTVITVTSRSTGFDPDLIFTRPGCSPEQAFAAADVRYTLSASVSGWHYWFVDGYGPNRELAGNFDLNIGACTFGRESASSVSEPGSDFELYPNPAPGGRFTVRLSGDQSATAQRLRVIDSQGRLVQEAALTEDGSSERSVDLKLSPGLYSVGIGDRWRKVIVP